MVEPHHGAAFITGLPDGEWKITLADGEPGYVVLIDQTGKHGALVVRLGEPNPYRYGAPPVTAAMLADSRALHEDGRKVGRTPLVVVAGEIVSASGFDIKQTPSGMVARPIVMDPKGEPQPAKETERALMRHAAMAGKRSVTDALDAKALAARHRFMMEGSGAEQSAVERRDEEQSGYKPSVERRNV